MIRFYPIKENFYPILNRHNAILEDLTLNKSQAEKILEKLETAQIKESAQSFFQTEIKVKDNVIFYEHPLKSDAYKLIIKDDYAMFEDEHNPFFELLKRKYRWWISCPIQDDK